MKIRALWLVLVLQLAVFGGLYAYRAIGLSGQSIRLRTVPVDPRDLLRGDYVILRYQISQVPPDADAPALTDGSVYVALRRVDGFGEISAVSRDAMVARTKMEPGGCVLRAELRNGGLTYDLERYYVPEGKGRSAPPGGKLVAEIAVRPNGNALIKRLYDENGKPWP